MTHGSEDDLLQARLDGELTAEQSQQVEEWARDNPAVQRRAAELTTLVEWIDETGAAQPPAGFVASVMARVRPRVLRFKRPALAGARGGRAEMKKALLAVAAVAAVMLVFFAIGGWPPADHSMGAIGAAKRYNSQQMSSSDVQVGDTSVQQFIQSDTFARLIKDKAAVKLLLNPELQQGLLRLATELQTDAQFRQSFVSADLASELRGQRFQGAVASADLRSYLGRADFAMELRQVSLQADLASQELASVFKAVELKGDLGGYRMSAELALKYPVLAGALNSPAFVQAIQSAKLGSALADQGLVSLLTSPGFATALSSSDVFAKFITSADFATALRAPAFMETLLRPGFAQALSHQGFAVELRQELEASGLHSDLRGELGAGQGLQGGIRATELTPSAR